MVAPKYNKDTKVGQLAYIPARRRALSSASGSPPGSRSVRDPWRSPEPTNPTQTWVESPASEPSERFCLLPAA